MTDSRILKSPTDYPQWLSRFHDVVGKLYNYASPRSLMTKEEAILAYVGPEPVAPGYVPPSLADSPAHSTRSRTTSSLPPGATTGDNTTLVVLDAATAESRYWEERKE